MATNSQKTRNGSPVFYNILEEMADIHDKKSHDYASSDNPYGNYHFAGQLACLFAHSPNDAGFVGRIAEKIYRLSNLEKLGKTPQNESVEDTETDIATITTLWVASRREARANIKVDPVVDYSEHGTACKIRQGAGCSCGAIYIPRT